MTGLRTSSSASWALRQRRADRGAATPALVQGFLLACGLAGVEAALTRFERLFDALEGDARCGLCPLRCAVLSTDEARCLSLLACAQAGELMAAAGWPRPSWASTARRPCATPPSSLSRR